MLDSCVAAVMYPTGSFANRGLEPTDRAGTKCIFRIRPGKVGMMLNPARTRASMSAG